jgi:hypothetical protein
VRDRQARGVDDLCEACGDKYSYCTACGEYIPQETPAEPVDDPSIEFAGDDIPAGAGGIRPTRDYAIAPADYRPFCPECKRTITCPDTLSVFNIGVTHAV